MTSLGDREHPNYAKYEHEKDAAYNAVVLRVATGEHDKAIVDGNKFLAAYGSSAEADEVVFQMGRAHQNAGRKKDAADLYKRYLARAKNLDHRAQGLVLLAQAQRQDGRRARRADVARRGGDPRQAPLARARRRRQVRRGARALHARASASSRSSRRSRSRAT